MLYKPGDRVMIRYDLKEGVYLSANGSEKSYAVSEMVEMAGRIVTITMVTGDGYLIREDNGSWMWTDDMFCEVK